MLELASMLNGEPFSDRPRSVCPALREHAPPRVTAWRARLCVDWARSVAGVESLSTKFNGSTLSNCARAGLYAAQVARSNPWCHGQTVAFFTWLARKSTPNALSPNPVPPSPPERPERARAGRQPAFAY